MQHADSGACGAHAKARGEACAFGFVPSAADHANDAGAHSNARHATCPE